MSKRSHKHLSREKKLLLVALLLGFALRLFYVGQVPGDGALWQDESYAGYNAWSLLHYGVDTSGYHRPVYLETWGSGMSIMLTLLEIPFVAGFGLSAFSVRLTRAVLGCIELIAFAALCREIRGEKFAAVGTFLLSVMPWDIMMSRFAMDCNALPPFLLFGLLFLIRAGKKNSRYLLLSMLFFGLSLYCYAATWIVMPFLILFCYVWYILAVRADSSRKTIDLWGILSVAVLGLLALPLILFVLVNMGFLEPMTGGFLDIPRLSSFRSGELSRDPKTFLSHLYNTIHLLVTQDDGRVSDVAGSFGLFYPFSYLLMLPGLGLSIFHMHREKKFRAEALLIVQLFLGLLLGGLLEEPYFSRINIVLLPMTYFLAVGCMELIEHWHAKASYVIGLTYLLSVCAFVSYYFTDHNGNCAKTYGAGLREALAYTDTIRDADDTVCFLTYVPVSDVLFYEKIPADLYLDTVVICDRGSGTIESRYPEKYAWYDATAAIDPANLVYQEITKNRIFLCASDNADVMAYMEENGLTVTVFANYAVGEWNH
ncbi:MAG: glycosyltransferase family 39 protein [Lachnospiraceae bacterium]